jgi:hypothetical protein
MRSVLVSLQNYISVRNYRTFYRIVEPFRVGDRVGHFRQARRVVPVRGARAQVPQ